MYRHKVPWDHALIATSIIDRHTSRSKSIISMVAVGSDRHMYVYDIPLGDFIGSTAFQCIFSLPVSHSTRHLLPSPPLPPQTPSLMIFQVRMTEPIQEIGCRLSKGRHTRGDFLPTCRMQLK